MTRTLAALAIALCLARAAVAQDTAPPPPMRGGTMMQDTARLRMLRERIQQRFGQMVQQELQLNDQQMQQLRDAMRAHQERRQELVRRQQAVNQALRWQLRPGIAADRDSLGKLLESQSHLRVEQAQQEEQLERSLTFLEPVQRARFMQMLRNFEQRVQEIRMRAGPRMGPGMGPRMGPGPGPGLGPRMRGGRSPGGPQPEF